MKNLGLYIHIPFCKRKCYYCDFISYPNMEEFFDSYIDSVIAEARLYESYIGKRSVDTVFIGGGTPSLLSPSQIKRLMVGLKNACNFNVEEITIESNPETLDEDKIAAYVNSGINRLSIGLQTHDNDILRRIGRRHSYETFLKAYNIAKQYYTNINVDTMFALPGQSTESFTTTIKNIVDLSPQHISSYALKLEPGTRLADTFAGIDELIDREMYHIAVEMFRKAGFAHYETSNFAKNGYQCLHNLKYWTNEEYLGLGVAAHSYVSHNGKNERFFNTDNIMDYIRTINDGVKPVVKKNTLSDMDQRNEYIMLRLRLKRGIIFRDYDLQFNSDFKNTFIEQIAVVKKAGLITENANGITPTLKGFDLQNTLITQFMKNV